MPRGDRTGPMGVGPRTGRGMGYCSGYSQPGFMNPGPGMGLARGFGRATGFGRGMAFGRRRGWAGSHPPPSMTAPMMPYPHPYAGGWGYPPMGYMGYPGMNAYGPRYW
ncbi:DUF5320 domain-containing protein [bacterium]|nr:DUF5320 domain-containing protein [bacterium]